MTYKPLPPAERVKWMSRQARRFLASKPLYQASIEYEADIDPFINCHHSWVSSESDLNDEGKEVQAYLLANPHLIEEGA